MKINKQKTMLVSRREKVHQVEIEKTKHVNSIKHPGSIVLGNAIKNKLLIKRNQKKKRYLGY